MSSPKSDRVAVFIDHSNVFKRLAEEKLNDPSWHKYYNPLALAQILAGSNRLLVSVNFYCSLPPSLLLTSENSYDIERYWCQMAYYDEVNKLPNLNIKFGRITGTLKNFKEKNLDTQLTTDMIVMAASNAFDTLILISNDGDYFNGLKAVKDMGRKIELVYFKHRVSMLLKKVSNVPRKARKSMFEKIKFQNC